MPTYIVPAHHRCCCHCGCFSTKDGNYGEVPDDVLGVQLYNECGCFEGVLYYNDGLTAPSGSCGSLGVWTGVVLGECEKATGCGSIEYNIAVCCSGGSGPAESQSYIMEIGDDVWFTQGGGDFAKCNCGDCPTNDYTCVQYHDPISKEKGGLVDDCVDDVKGVIYELYKASCDNQSEDLPYSGLLPPTKGDVSNPVIPVGFCGCPVPCVVEYTLIITDPSGNTSVSSDLAYCAEGGGGGNCCTGVAVVSWQPDNMFNITLGPETYTNGSFSLSNFTPCNEKLGAGQCDGGQFCFVLNYSKGMTDCEVCTTSTEGCSCCPLFVSMATTFSDCVTGLTWSLSFHVTECCTGIPV